jgi:hypothetical protein
MRQPHRVVDARFNLIAMQNRVVGPEISNPARPAAGVSVYRSHRAWAILPSSLST